MKRLILILIICLSLILLTSHSYATKIFSTPKPGDPSVGEILSDWADEIKEKRKKKAWDKLSQEFIQYGDFSKEGVKKFIRMHPEIGIEELKHVIFPIVKQWNQIQTP